MIFGDIGSGKSALLLSILNEFNKKKQSEVEINGKVAYVSQKPWIFSGTIQSNI
jgi:ATP-binding cassette subfamily C (CFTR/MRP) protein 4